MNPAKNGSITTIDIGHGELEFLLLLDSADRRINAFISSEKTREIVENSFITNHYNRIIFAKSKKEALELPADWLVVKTTNSTIKTESDYFGLEIVCENENLIIFKKKGIS